MAPSQGAQAQDFQGRALSMACGQAWTGSRGRSNALFAITRMGHYSQAAVSLVRSKGPTKWLRELPPTRGGANGVRVRSAFGRLARDSK